MLNSTDDLFLNVFTPGVAELGEGWRVGGLGGEL